MARPQKLEPAQIVTVLEQTKGLPALAAERLGCSVSTLYNYADRYPEVKEAMTHQREKRLDIAEGQLWTMINAGNLAATIFYLKCHGRSRGYIERQNIEVTAEDLDSAIAKELERLAHKPAATDEDTEADSNEQDPAVLS